MKNYVVTGVFTLFLCIVPLAGHATGSKNSSAAADATAVQGQVQGQAQAQELNATQLQSTKVSTVNVNQSTNKNTNRLNSNSDAKALSSSGSFSSSKGGDASSSSSATGGNGYAQGGDGGQATAIGGSTESSVGDTTAVVGDTSATVGDTTTGDVQSNVSVTDARSTNLVQSAASAASVFAAVCQTGGSGQTMQGGFSVINPDLMCDNLQLAAVLRDAYVFEMESGRTEKANEYLSQYYEVMSDALSLVRSTKEVGLIDRFAGYLVRPAALIGVLIWLI